MGYRNKEPFIVELIEIIAKIHYGFGLAIAVVFIGMALFLIPELLGGNDEFGKQMLIHVVPTCQWICLGIAGVSLLAAVYSFFTNR